MKQPGAAARRPGESREAGPSTRDAVLQRKCETCDDEEPLKLQRKPSTGGGVGAIPPVVGEVLRSGGRPLDSALRADFEPLFRHDFSRVRVHADGGADTSARAVDARAYTVGRDIVFRAGQYAPHTPSGRQLLAHELTHVVQQSGGGSAVPGGVVDAHHASEREADRMEAQVAAGTPGRLAAAAPAWRPSTGGAAGALQRKPGLGVQVPEVQDPAKVPELETRYDYQWQDPNLLETVYGTSKTEGNERLNSLRQFLFIQKEAALHHRYSVTGDDLTNEKAREIAAAEATQVREQLTRTQAAIKDKKAQLASTDAQLRQTALELKAAQAHKRDTLRKDRRAQELMATRASARTELERHDKSLAMADQNLAWVEKTKATLGEKKYQEQLRFWEGKKQQASERKGAAEGKVAGTQAEYDLLIGPLDEPIERLGRQQAELQTTSKVLKKELKDAEAESKVLSAELQNIAKVTAGNAGAILKWKLQHYTRQLKDMSHEQLLREIQTLFDKDDGTRYPEWVRYAVIHLSGMRYASAHGSWYSPQRLLQLLKTSELEAASPETRRGMVARGQALLEAHPDRKGLELTGAEKKTLAGSEGDAVTRKLAGADVQAYAEVQRIEARLQSLFLELQHLGANPPEAERVRQAIAKEDASLASEEAKLTPKGLKQVRGARASRQAVLFAIYERNARAKLGVLNDKQALSLLKQMKDAGQIPDAVWKELTAFTQLRLETADPTWEDATKSKGLKDVVGATPQEQAQLDAWRKVLSKEAFYKDSTGWRAQHGKTLSPSLTSSLVCDQLGSYLQNVRGHVRPGGLRANAMYYQSQQDQRVPGAFLKRPTSAADLPPGASIYWLQWSDLPMEQEYMKHYKASKQLEAQVEALRKSKPQSDKLKQLELQLASAKKALQGMRAFKPEAGKLPDISNMVSPMGAAGGALRFEDIATGPLGAAGDPNRNPWTYKTQVQLIGKHSVTTIMRAMPNPYDCANGKCTVEFSTTPNPQVVKQWLTFMHEATVMYSDKDLTVTFDTATQFAGQDVAAMGARKRLTSELIDNPKVLVGFAPGSQPKVPVGPYLKDYLDKLGKKSGQSK
ncbi:eCIS core domain-containing protein [Pyxidicoccus xibeiensis]|uniref:eCIS core domain-containing protein n=1 Tax=Pyxidicoccus xibeiensis TaxID=2906759 RepID=UPI0020A733AA|nr:DUF4157 domain-containing protein [Pyxidicoccus xibeiensis]MCP3138163.1 DUF4157 domain-containing protein [Pyxidicoccus xibeiensis]